jgi:hypothetical protein
MSLVSSLKTTDVSGTISVPIIFLMYLLFLDFVRIFHSKCISLTWSVKLP